MLAHWQSLAEIVAGHLLNSVAEGLAIALLASVLFAALGKLNSSTRFAALLTTLGVITALPIVEVFRHSGRVLLSIHSAFSLPAAWAWNITIAWTMIASIGLSRIALGFWQLRKLRKTCRPVDAMALHPATREALQVVSRQRKPVLCRSDQIRVPTALGFFKPAIVMPGWAFSELNITEFNAVVLHELAHLRRWDDWTNLAQKIIRAIFFFHPAVWWIGRNLAREREMACDDFVLSATSDRRAYAECLVSVAEKTFLRRGLALAQALVGRVQLTAQRVARILAGDRMPAIKIWRPALGMFAAFSMVCLVVIPKVPSLVAFDSSPTSAPSVVASHPALASNDTARKDFSLKVIPATFRTEAQEKRFPARPAKRNAINKIVSNQIVVNEPSHKPYVAENTVTHAASAIEAFSQPIAQANVTDVGFTISSQPSAVLVFMQTDRVDENGQVWSVSVWRLTVFHPADRAVYPQVRKGVVPKST